MSVQSFACPACGSRKALPDPQPGEKIHCTCGMSFPASPVFAVAEAVAKTTPRAPLFGAIFVLMIFGGAATAWLMNRPTPKMAGTPMAAGQPVAEPEPAPASEAKAVEKSEALTTRPTEPQGPPQRPEEKEPPAGPLPQPPPPPPPPPTPVATLSAVTLWDAFDLDPPAAATRFGGKVVEVIGRGKVAADSFGRPYFGVIVVKPGGRKVGRLTPEEQYWERDGYPPSVRFYLTPGQAEALAEVTPDQDVVIRGTTTGRKTVDGVYRGYIVEIRDCAVMSPK